MWMPKNSVDQRREGSCGLVAVAIDKDKGSQYALKWVIDHLLQRGQTVILIHVNLKSPSFSATPSLGGSPSWLNQVVDANGESTLVYKDPDSLQTKELFFPFRCFCTRRDIQCKDVVLEDIDVAKGLIEYVSQTAIEALVVGASSKTGFLRRFKTTDIPGSVSKGAPDFCSVYVISKGKISSMKSASRPAPTISPQATSTRSVERPPLDPPRKSNDETQFSRWREWREVAEKIEELKEREMMTPTIYISPYGSEGDEY